MSNGFIDTARISVKGGAGGNGVVSFHREKYVAAGGPDGGDGGNGGNIVLRVDDHMATLMDFRYTRKYAAPSGENGMGKRQSGKRGADLVIKVPRGTVVRDAESGAIMHDMSDGEDWIAAKGGRGGWGNQHFATSTRQTPRFAKSGLAGESRDIILELKLIADVGLIGFPNVGKSTLLAAVSAARPKIANYHFTTLQPNLGVVRVDENISFVMADIPGMIEGAAEGAGLGHDFLRHVDRCRLLVHLVDVSGSEGRDPAEDFDAINRELAGWSEALASRPQIVAANKSDLVTDDSAEAAAVFRALAEDRGLEYFEISAATGSGVRDLIYAISRQLETLPPVEPFEPEYVEPELELGSPEDVEITVEDGVYFLEGEWLDRISRNVNFDDLESRLWFERTLRTSGMFKRLEREGIQEGDTVVIGDLEFDYIP